MPAKGTRKLPNKKRVELVIAKELKPRGTSTNESLALEFDIKPQTVRAITYNKLTDEQKALYAEMVADLKHEGLGLTTQALRKSQELVQLAENAKDLAGVVAAGKFGHDVFRLETGQSTSNINTGESAVQRMVSFYVSKGYTQEAAVQALFTKEALGSLGVSEEDMRLLAAKVVEKK
jgi:hypothetical protein